MLVAALGEQMLKLAGTLTDGTVTWMTGPATLATHTVPTITRPRPSGRAGPRRASPLAADLRHRRHRRGARARRKDFQVYGFLPSYRAMLDREGAAVRPTSRSSATRRPSRSRCRALADAGVTEYVASIYGSREERAETRALLKSML